MLKALRWLGCAATALLAAVSHSQTTGNGPLAADRKAKDLLLMTRGLVSSPTRVLVRYRAEANETARGNARRKAQGLLLHRSSLVPNLEILDSKLGAQSAIASLKADPSVLYAEPDGILQPLDTPNDCEFPKLWGLDEGNDCDINAVEAWTLTTGASQTVIADIDTGADSLHPDLAANIFTNPGEIADNGIDDDHNGYIDDVHGWDFFANDNIPEDTNGHGTHTAGIFGAVGNNAIGISGVNWRSKIMPLRFMGPGGGYDSDAIRAIEYACKMGVRISNNSWGSTTYNQSLKDAITAAQASGHVFVAAAGNSASDADTLPLYPAAYDCPNIISVGATAWDGTLASFSNYGATSVDIAAPGNNVYSTLPGGTYGYMSGTSMASPFVAGVAGLLLTAHPDWTFQQIKDRMLLKARRTASLSGKCVSGGSLDAYAALSDAPKPPNVSVLSPTQLSRFARSNVVLIANAGDGVDGDLTSRIAWTDSLAGPLGSGGICVLSQLAPGAHAVSARVVDSRGISVCTTVNFTVESDGPALSIQQPMVPLTITEGGVVNLQGSATDPFDGSLASKIQWTSNLQGAIARSATYQAGNLCVGKHLIIASVTDSQGINASAVGQVTVTPAIGVPAAPGPVSLAKIPYGTQLKWSDKSNNEACFEIEQQHKIDSKTWGAANLLATTWANTVSFNDYPGAGTGSFRYRIRAKNSNGCSAWTAWSSAVRF